MPHGRRRHHGPHGRDHDQHHGGPHGVDRRVARTTEAVLAAGRELLATEGPEAVTHLRISETTGIARTTIYRHWPDREALLEAVLAEPEQPAPWRIDTGAVETDLQEYFRRLARRGGRRNGPRNAGLADVVARADRHRRFAEMRRERVQRLLEPLRDIIRRGVDRGELRADIDVEEEAVDLLAPLFFRRFFLGESPGTDLHDRVVDDFLRRARTDEG